MYTNRISAATERRKGKQKQPKKDPILERERGKVYVLCFMVVTFPTCQVERSPLKALAPQNTAPSNQEKSKDTNGLEKKKRREHCSKIELVLPQKEEGKKKQQRKDPIYRRGERVYVLPNMVVTFPTCHLERSPLKSPAV